MGLVFESSQYMALPEKDIRNSNWSNSEFQALLKSLFGLDWKFWL